MRVRKTKKNPGEFRGGEGKWKWVRRWRREGRQRRKGKRERGEVGRSGVGWGVGHRGGEGNKTGEQKGGVRGSERRVGRCIGGEGKE